MPHPRSPNLRSPLYGFCPPAQNAFLWWSTSGEERIDFVILLFGPKYLSSGPIPNNHSRPNLNQLESSSGPLVITFTSGFWRNEFTPPGKVFGVRKLLLPPNLVKNAPAIAPSFPLCHPANPAAPAIPISAAHDPHPNHAPLANQNPPA